MAAEQARAAALVYGDGGDAAAALLWRLAAQWRAAGLHVAGVLNPVDIHGRRISSHLEEVGGGRLFAVLQDLGSGSTACCLDGGGLAEAAAAAREALADAPDVLLLNKFGHAEAENGGFRAEMLAAAGAGVPLLTRVHRRHLADWRAFAAGMAAELPLEERAAAAWLAGIRRGSA